MNEEQLLSSIKLPKSTYVLRTFPYNKIEPHLNAAQKKMMAENVIARGIRLLAVISPNNTNIPKYEDEKVWFEEIHFYWIQIKNLKKSLAIYKIFAKIMPYPLVILFTDGKLSRWVLTAHTKQKQTHFLSIEQIYEFDESITFEEIVNGLDFQKMENLNLRTVYESWIKQLLQVELKYKYGIVQDVSLDHNLLQQLKDLDRRIAQLVNEARRERQMNKRIALQLEAEKLKSAKRALMEKES